MPQEEEEVNRSDLHRYSEMKKIMLRIWSGTQKSEDLPRLAGLSRRPLIRIGDQYMLPKFQGRGVLSPISELEYLCWRKCEDAR